MRERNDALLQTIAIRKSVFRITWEKSERSPMVVTSGM